MVLSPLVVTEVSRQGVLDNGVDGERLSLFIPIVLGSIETFPQTLLYFQLKLRCDQNRAVGESEYPVWFQLYFYWPHDVYNVKSLLFLFNIFK